MQYCTFETCESRLKCLHGLEEPANSSVQPPDIDPSDNYDGQKGRCFFFADALNYMSQSEYKQRLAALGVECYGQHSHLPETRLEKTQAKPRKVGGDYAHN